VLALTPLVTSVILIVSPHEPQLLPVH